MMHKLLQAADELLNAIDEHWTDDFATIEEEYHWLDTCIMEQGKRAPRGIPHWALVENLINNMRHRFYLMTVEVDLTTLSLEQISRTRDQLYAIEDLISALSRELSEILKGEETHA